MRLYNLTRWIHAGHRLRTRTRSVRDAKQHAALTRVRLRAEMQWNLSHLGRRAVHTSTGLRGIAVVSVRRADCPVAHGGRRIIPREEALDAASAPHADRCCATDRLTPA